MTKNKLSSMGNIVGGGTPNTGNPAFWDGDINWFTPSEIDKTMYVIESLRKITKKGLDSSSAKILPTGTILFTSRATLGEMSILTKEATTNQGFQSNVVKQIVVVLVKYFVLCYIVL